MMNETLGPGDFRPQMPFHMVWLATNACTARCMHCSSNSAKRSHDELTTDEVFDLIDQLARAGVVDLGISGGEPFIRRDLLEIVAHSKLRGMSVGVATNGAKLRPDQAAQLFELGLNRLQISLDGLAAAHDRLRRWPGLFERVLRAIEVARAAGLKVHICCTITRLNAGELDEFVEFLARLDVHRLNFSRYVPTGRGSYALDLDDRDWHAIIHQCTKLRDRFKGRLEIVTHLAQQIIVDGEVADMPGFIGCQAGQGQGCVTANGTVLPCVLLPVPVGNVRDQPFAEIWRTSSVIHALQNRGYLEGKCANCSIRERCGGCRAVALAKTGNYLAADPRCWLESAHAFVQ